MKNNLNLEITGHLRVVELCNGIEKVLYDDHNDLDYNHLNIIRQALAGEAVGAISKIRAMNSGLTLALTNIAGVTMPINPSNEVEFSAIFDESSFNGTVDELRLESFGIGVFSFVENLSIAKDHQSKIAITWKLSINTQ